MQAVDHLHEHHDDHDHHDHDHSRERAQAWTKAALLIGLGLYFVYNIVSGSLTNYINARFSWLSYVAAVLFLLLGVSSVWGLLRGGHQHTHDDHDHEAVTWGVLAVIAVPLLLGTLIPSRPLGAAAVDGNISLSASVSTGSVTTFTGDPLTWNVLDWLRSFNQSDNIASFNGKEADVIGFVYREITFGADQFMVARFTISCCVADSSAIGLPVVFADAGQFKADTWVRVHGNFQVGEFKGENVPLLYADTVEVVDQPEHPYLYP